MRKLACFTFVVVLAAALFSGCHSAKGKTSQEVSGRIVIYTSMYEDVIKSVREDLRKRFPDLSIDFVFGGTGALQAKIASEMAANKLGCDILMVADPAYSLELKEKGVLHPYISREAFNLAYEYDVPGYWYPVRISNMVLAYNPARNARNSVPNSFYEFAHDERVKGAVSMSNPVTSGTSMAAITALKDRYGYEYFDALSEQGVVIESGAVAVAKLETGERKVAMILEESILKVRQEEKSNLEVIYPMDGAIIIPSAIMIVNNHWNANKNTLAAEAIVDWFLGVDGQNSIVNGWMRSVLRNFQRLPFDAAPIDEMRGGITTVNWDNVLSQKNEIQDKFEEMVIYKK